MVGHLAWKIRELTLTIRVVSFDMTSCSTRSGKSIEHNQMQRLLSDLKAHPLAWAFLIPVNADEVPDYYGVIKRPMGPY